MSAYDIAFVGALCWRFKELMPLLREHLKDYETLLPHVFMGDVTRWMIRLYRSDGSNTELRQVLEFFEEAFAQASIEDRELISASFLENLPTTDMEGTGIRLLLGPTLRTQLERIG
jgi:hypothetical protein